MDKIYTIRYKNMLNELKISQSELINILLISKENNYRSLEDVISISKAPPLFFLLLFFIDLLLAINPSNSSDY